MDVTTTYMLTYNECNDTIEFTVDESNELIHVASYTHTYTLGHSMDVLNHKTDIGWIEYEITENYVWVTHPTDGEWMVYPDESMYQNVVDQANQLLIDTQEATLSY
ncbi:hypothetical protein VCO01S_30750 [Vibrio comitans NBRC 102076]|uniref:Uncharacterized protein n=2 Tax=Vibrio comitans TaxID=413401 RepID=A0A4Y3IRZ3_9VIBR|nr:hypothetical protein VCO01S_30750 [Vibrio comitans NBRC 102076]